MCGLWGYVAGQLADFDLGDETANRCVGGLRHRGPDGQGMWWAPPIALGHTRLAIVDPGPAADQPMHSRDGRHVLLFNGEIYNYRELRAVLVDRGHRFDSDGDTEVVLAAYQEWGRECVSRLRGMFAVCIVDTVRREVWLARDRAGIKPLYYLQQPGRLAFCSELTGLLPLLGGTPRLDLDAVSAYLALRHVPAPDTLISGIRQLAAGTDLSWCGSSTTVRTWWQPPRRRALSGARRRPHTMRELLADAVSDCVGSGEPWSCYLSGGLDSSALAQTVPSTARPLRLLTASYAEPGYSEVTSAQLMADHLGLALEVVPVDGLPSVRYLLALTSRRDHPLALHNEVALGALAEAVSDGGSRVVLSGEGADELLSGYGRLSRLPFERTKDRVRRRLLRQQDRRQEPWHRHVADHRLRTVLETYPYFPFGLKFSLLRPTVRAALDDDRVLLRTLSAAWAEAGRAPMHRQLRHFLVRIHLPGLLRALDSSGMAYGVETRFPYLDHRIVEWAMRLPSRSTLRWRSWRDVVAAWRETPQQYSERRDVTKVMLRQAFADELPGEILARRKMPFPAPLGEAFRQTSADELRDFVLGPDARVAELFDPAALLAWWRAGCVQGSGTFGRQAWLVVALELWLRTYLPCGPLLADARPTAAAGRSG